jgi:hypothetical protein
MSRQVASTNEEFGWQMGLLANASEGKKVWDGLGLLAWQCQTLRVSLVAGP